MAENAASELRKLPVEMDWVEFKETNSNPEDIDEYLSALNNAAAVHGKANGNLLWGVQERRTHLWVPASSPSGRHFAKTCPCIPRRPIGWHRSRHMAPVDAERKAKVLSMGPIGSSSAGQKTCPENVPGSKR